MSGCHNPQKNRNPQCVACNGLPWFGVNTPKCTCNDPILSIPTEPRFDINYSEIWNQIRKIIEKIEKLERDNNLIFNEQENLSNRLSQLEHFGSFPIVASLRNLDERLKKIEEINSIHEINLEGIGDHIEDFIEIHKSILKRIEELEISFNKINAEVTAINKQKFSEFHHLRPDIEKLEERIKELEKNKYVQQVQYFGSKKPHKCPVCEGNSKIQVMHGTVEPFEQRIIDSQGRHFVLCNTCEGKGIVWG